MNVLITGAAGFIGSHLVKKRLSLGDNVVGLDNLNDYYDVSLKEGRLNQFREHPNFTFIKCDLADKQAMAQLFSDNEFDCVVNLAAQAGVRYSLQNPHAYINSNLVGFCNILENCRQHHIKHLVFASSSSVYGANTQAPFSEHHSTDHPIALYAATKKANEMMAHSYASLFNIPCTGLRFFTVYGPWGRPDMALFKFTKNILENKPIDVYNHGDMVRDFTFIDDIIEGVSRVMEQPAKPNKKWSSTHPDPATSYAPYRIYNIGNNNPVRLLDYINAIEKALGKQAQKNMLPMQPGDVPMNCANVSDLENNFDFRPQTQVEEGIQQFVEWYLEYYNSRPIP